MESYIGLGSNLDNPEQQLTRALALLDETPDITLVRCSSFYGSRPLGGPANQPDFVNAVAQLRSDLPARALLRRLQCLENKQGRVRTGEKWGPRVLDLDLLLYGAERIAEPGLTVPHPEIRHRNFVLTPLLELAPNIEIPGLGRAAELPGAASHDGITRLDASPT